MCECEWLKCYLKCVTSKHIHCFLWENLDANYPISVCPQPYMYAIAPHKKGHKYMRKWHTCIEMYILNSWTVHRTGRITDTISPSVWSPMGSLEPDRNSQMNFNLSSDRFWVHASELAASGHRSIEDWLSNKKKSIHVKHSKTQRVTQVSLLTSLLMAWLQFKLWTGAVKVAVTLFLCVPLLCIYNIVTSSFTYVVTDKYSDRQEWFPFLYHLHFECWYIRIWSTNLPKYFFYKLSQHWQNEKYNVKKINKRQRKEGIDRLILNIITYFSWLWETPHNHDEERKTMLSYCSYNV